MPSTRKLLSWSEPAWNRLLLFESPVLQSRRTRPEEAVKSSRGAPIQSPGCPRLSTWPWWVPPSPERHPPIRLSTRVLG